MKTKLKSEAGFTHYAFIIGFLVVLAGVVGFAAYRTYKDVAVTYDGVLEAQPCSSADPSCTDYTLVTADKTYTLSVTNAPTIASGTQVAVTGKSVSSSSGQPTITVKSIKPVTAGSSSSAASSSSTNSSSPATSAGGNTSGVVTTTITNANNGQTIDLSKGQQLIVALTATGWNSVTAGKVEQQQQPWSISVGNGQILSLVSSTKSTGVGSQSGEYTTTTTNTYDVAAAGTTSVSGASSAAPICSPKTECPNYLTALDFSVTAVVD